MWKWRQFGDGHDAGGITGGTSGTQGTVGVGALVVTSESVQLLAVVGAGPSRRMDRSGGNPAGVIEFTIGAGIAEWCKVPASVAGGCFWPWALFLPAFMDNPPAGQPGQQQTQPAPSNGP